MSLNKRGKPNRARDRYHLSIDRSGSMDDDAHRLKNLDTFINELSNYTDDWQIIIPMVMMVACQHHLSSLQAPPITGDLSAECL